MKVNKTKLVKGEKYRVRWSVELDKFVLELGKNGRYDIIATFDDIDISSVLEQSRDLQHILVRELLRKRIKKWAAEQKLIARIGKALEND